MMDFDVWAPNASSVELVTEETRRPMVRRERGWWHVPVDTAGTGTRYGYSLDGGRTLPDPRSRSQPDGVHAPSEVVDHSAFRWTDGSWRGLLPKGPIYELHVGTFTVGGTFDAACARLDHLVELGIECVEVMPVAAFPGERGWGYDGVDLFAVHRAYGGPDGLKRLVDACHERGLAVILDVVYNHLGPDGNYLGEFGPYFTARYKTPWGAAVNFDDRGSNEVRAFVIDNALAWLEDYHIDGLRLDAVHAIFDQSAIHILEELQTQVEALKNRLDRTVFIIAESDLNDPRLVTPRDAGGFGLHAQWNDDFHHALHSLLTGERDGYYADFGSVAHLAKSLERVFVYDGYYSAFRGRRHGRPVEELPGLRFVACLQNHDQVGNRAQGERSSHLMSYELLKVGAALVLTAPFVPLLFQGEEWAATTPFAYFIDHREPGLGAAVTEGRRREFATFGWARDEVLDPQDPQTFEMSKLDWSEIRVPHHAGMLQWHKDLIALRQATPALNDGRLDLVTTRYERGRGWLIVERGPITVAANFSDELAIAPLARVRASRVILASAEPPEIGNDEVHLGPESVTILSE